MNNVSYKNKAKKVFGFLQTMSSEAPELTKGFFAMHEATGKDKSLTAKQKELMSLAISIVIRCEDCIACHVQAALQAGASHEEIVETIEVAIMMGGGPAVAYGAKAYDALKEMNHEVNIDRSINN